MNSAGVSFDMYDEAKNAAFSYDPVHEVMSIINKQTYGEFNEASKNLKKPQYNYLIWNSSLIKAEEEND